MGYESIVENKIGDICLNSMRLVNCEKCELRKGCSCMAYHVDLERGGEFNKHQPCEECRGDAYKNFNVKECKITVKPGLIKNFKELSENIDCVNCSRCFRINNKEKGCTVYGAKCNDSKPCDDCVNDWFAEYDEMHLIVQENKADKTFKEALQKIKYEGVWDENPRPVWHDGAPAHSKFITQWVEQYDISKGEFPMTQIKPTAWKTGIKEIFWIYQAQSNDLQLAKDEYGIKWWEDWNIGDGTIGFRYGHTVKRYNLINNLIDGIKTNPYGRRHIINLWQEEEFKDEKKGLNPCAFMTMWSVRGEYLDCTLIQRSNDACVAYNINNIQYVALQMMIAHSCGLKPGSFMRVVQNLHVYDRHLEACDEYLSRYGIGEIPKLIFEPKSDNFFEFSIDDFRVEGYNPDKQIKTEVAI